MEVFYSCAGGQKWQERQAWLEIHLAQLISK